MQWHRRISEAHYTATNISECADYWPADPDEQLDVYFEMVDAAQSELVLAVCLAPRYELKAKWLSKDAVNYIRIQQSCADDVTQERLEEVREQIFGTLQVL